jgi:Repeat of Unknown Function (DUF347)
MHRRRAHCTFRPWREEGIKFYLGASLGDLLSQPGKYGGLGLGATTTSVIFLAGIIAIVTYLVVTKKDVVAHALQEEKVDDKQKGGLRQTIAVVLLLIVAGGIGYGVRQTSLESMQNVHEETGSVSGTVTSDTAEFLVIAQDTLGFVKASDQTGAVSRVADLEHEWDVAESVLKPKNTDRWTRIDDAIDAVLRQVRAVRPNMSSEEAALTALIAVLESGS